jgi:hypothetical protein
MIPYRILADVDAQTQERLAKASKAACECQAAVNVCPPDCLCDCHVDDVENYHDAE